MPAAPREEEEEKRLFVQLAGRGGPRDTPTEGRRSDAAGAREAARGAGSNATRGMARGNVRGAGRTRRAARSRRDACARLPAPRERNSTHRATKALQTRYLAIVARTLRPDGRGRAEHEVVRPVVIQDIAHLGVLQPSHARLSHEIDDVFAVLPVRTHPRGLRQVDGHISPRRLERRRVGTVVVRHGRRFPRDAR